LKGGDTSDLGFRLGAALSVMKGTTNKKIETMQENKE
jgi:hypothetical protein